MNDKVKAAIRHSFPTRRSSDLGLATMVADDRYCIDIVTQISAVQAALQRAEEELLREHVSHCVEGAINSGNKGEQRKKITELMQVLSRSKV